MLDGLGFARTDFQKPAEAFSGGWQMRIALGKILLQEPDLLLLDEPTAALSVVQTAEVLMLIERLRDMGLGVILISHNMPHVFEIADRIHIARLGKRAAVVNPKKISMSDTVAVMTGAKSAAELPEDCLA